MSDHFPPEDIDEPPPFDGPGMDPILREPADTTGRRRLKAAERLMTEKNERRHLTAKAMLSQPAGREFLAWILYELASVNGATIDPTFNRAVSEFRAGQRDIGLKLHRLLLAADKSGYMVLISEHSD